jgi:hypothetical protein
MQQRCCFKFWRCLVATAQGGFARAKRPSTLMLTQPIQKVKYHFAPALSTTLLRCSAATHIHSMVDITHQGDLLRCASPIRMIFVE